MSYTELVSPTRRLGHYLLRYRLRYAAGVGCLLAATGFALGIPWMVKSAVDALGREGGAALPRYVLAILGLAAGHGVARMASRFTMLGAGQWVERDVFHLGSLRERGVRRGSVDERHPLDRERRRVPLAKLGDRHRGRQRHHVDARLPLVEKRWI